MQIEVRSDTSLSTEIDYDRDGKRETALLIMDGGEWKLVAYPQSGERWIAGRRIGWHEALKRALVILAPAN